MRKKEIFVQTIPYGESLSKSKIKVDNEGKIVIIGKNKIWHLPDLDTAIRQQLFHVLTSYEDLIVNWKKQLIHKGKISEIQNLEQEINHLLNNKALINLELKNLNESIQILNKLQEELKDKEKNKIQILTLVLIRGKKLIEEKKRCEKLIMNFFTELCTILYYLDQNSIDKIKWGNYIEAVKKLTTIHVNPYRQKIQTPLFLKHLRYDLYKKIKSGDINEARNLIWKGINKLIPLYPAPLEIQIGKEIFIIENGRIIIK